MSKRGLFVQMSECDHLSWVVSPEGRCSEDEARRAGVVASVLARLSDPGATLYK